MDSGRRKCGEEDERETDEERNEREEDGVAEADIVGFPDHSEERKMEATV